MKHVHACGIYTCLSVQVLMPVHMQKAEEDAMSPTLSLSIRSVKTGSLSVSGVMLCYQARAVLLSITVVVIGLQTCAHVSFFCEYWGLNSHPPVCITGTFPR